MHSQYPSTDREKKLSKKSNRYANDTNKSITVNKMQPDSECVKFQILIVAKIVRRLIYNKDQNKVEQNKSLISVNGHVY